MPETKRDKIYVRVVGFLITLASIAAIALVYLGRHGKGPLSHVDISGDVTNYYFGAGVIAVMGIVVPFAKPKGKKDTEEQPAQGQPQQQVQAPPPQGQQPPSQYPQQWAQPQQGQYPQYPPQQQPPSQYPQQQPYDPNRPS